MIFNFLIFIFIITVGICTATQECVWATGKLLCRHNQTLVLGSVVELWDEDSMGILKLVDPDDKIAFTIINSEDGIFEVSGCASDQDWLPGVKNRPEMFLKVLHNCNLDKKELLVIKPTFNVFVPRTYDYHIQHPIILD
uniref:Transthyretin-like family protein n=1 Tax=Parastrongyloides trichosuri TaxID=131310 RepID=A0A0N4ZHY4_PARTI